MEKIIYYSTFLLVRKEIRTWNQHVSFSLSPFCIVLVLKVWSLDPFVFSCFVLVCFHCGLF